MSVLIQDIEVCLSKQGHRINFAGERTLLGGLLGRIRHSHHHSPGTSFVKTQPLAAGP